MVIQTVIIDTSILIDYLRQSTKQDAGTQLEKLLNNESLHLIISAATIQELFAGQSSRNKEKEMEIRELLKNFVIIPIEPTIAEIAGNVMRDNKKKIIQFADAQIAATAIQEKAYLATINKKDFDWIEGIKLYE